MREEKQIERIIGKKILRMEKRELEGISSINNLVALKRCGIYRIEVTFEDGSSSELLMKIKSNNVIKNGTPCFCVGSRRTAPTHREVSL